MQKLEIERKFLIKKPDEAALKCLEGIRIVRITQLYTTVGARLRKWEENGEVSYIKTVKSQISNITRVEKEEEISEREYNELCALKKPDTEPLLKTRYIYPYKTKNVEVDIFPFWKNWAFCEVELDAENEEFELPDFIRIIQEVTDDKRFRNYALSKNIPKEENF